MIDVDVTIEEVTIHMDENAKKHLEFSVEEDVDGTFRAVERFCDGGKLIYAGFPNWKEAEKFVLSQPECWE